MTTLPIPTATAQPEIPAHLREFFATEIAAAVQLADAARAAIEDNRANRRNRNRFYMLGVTLAFMFAVPLVLGALGLTELIKFGPAMALVPDAGLTLWAKLRKL